MANREQDWTIEDEANTALSSAILGALSRIGATRRLHYVVTAWFDTDEGRSEARVEYRSVDAPAVEPFGAEAA